MNPPQIHTLDYHGKTLRVLVRDDEPWFVVSDLCRILSIYMRDGKPAAHEAMRRLRPGAKDHYSVETSGGPRLAAIVNRDGAADLAAWAKHPNAPDLIPWANEAIPA